MTKFNWSNDAISFHRTVQLSNGRSATETYAVLLIAGFLYGYDCLDDLEQFQSNPLITERFGEEPSAKAFGDWLRSFESEHLTKLSDFLLHQAHFARKQIDALAAVIADMDSTAHVQHGVKLEGLAYDYEARAPNKKSGANLSANPAYFFYFSIGSGGRI